MGEKRHFGGKLSVFFHLVFDAFRASGLDAIGSPRAPLPDPSLKTGTFQRGPLQNGLNEAIKFGRKRRFGVKFSIYSHSNLRRAPSFGFGCNR